MKTIALVIVLGGDLVKSTEHMGIAYIAACLREKQYIVDIIEIRDASDIEAVQELTIIMMFMDLQQLVLH